MRAAKVALFVLVALVVAACTDDIDICSLGLCQKNVCTGTTSTDGAGGSGSSGTCSTSSEGGSS